MTVMGRSMVGSQNRLIWQEKVLKSVFIYVLYTIIDNTFSHRAYIQEHLYGFT